MKKVLFVLFILLLTLSFSIPAAVSAADPPSTLSVVSDASAQVIGVYNKYTGNFVDLSGSPLNAVLAAEPNPYPTVYPSEPPESLNSTWDTGTGLYFQNTNPGADWIWETARAEDPATVYSPSNSLYDPDASSNGRVVVFEKTFFIPGTPQSATLNIAADNCYEVWVNGNQITRSATAKVAGWETTDLHEGSVGSDGWQTVGHYTIPASDLIANDTNTIKITAGNEYYSPTDPNFEFNNSPVPPFTADPYTQRNPGAMIFKMDVTYDSTPTPPVPELPAGILLGLGLLIVGGFVLVKRKKAAKI